MIFLLDRFKRFVLTLLLLASLTTSAFAQGPTILVLWADFGKGHRTAAEVIAKEIQRQDPTATVIIQNGREFMKERMGSIGKWAFDYLQPNHHKLYHALYKVMMFQAKLAKKFNWQMPSVGHMKLDHMQRFTEAVMPDAIVDAWPLTVEARIELKKAGLKPYDDAALFYQMTDWERELYFKVLADASITAVPNKAIHDLFVKQGSDPSKLMDTGIPSEFKHEFPADEQARQKRREEALERVREHLAQGGRADFDVKVPTFTLEGGANGVGNYPLMAASLALAAGGKPIQILAACGVMENPPNKRALESFGSKKLNERVLLFMKLSKLLGKKFDGKRVGVRTLWKLVSEGLPNTRIYAHGYTDKLMDFRFASLFTIAKPGALSLTETGGNGIPTLVGNKREASVEVANVRELREMGVIEASKNEAGMGPLINERIAQGGEAILDKQREFRDGIRTDLFVGRILSEANAVRAKREQSSPDRVLTLDQIRDRIQAVPGLVMEPEIYLDQETHKPGVFRERMKELEQRAIERRQQLKRLKEKAPAAAAKKAA